MKCEYCGKYILDNLYECPFCGAENHHFVDEDKKKEIARIKAEREREAKRQEELSRQRKDQGCQGRP